MAHRLPDRPDGEPTEVSRLRHGDVGAHFPAESAGVKGESLLLVVHPQLSVGKSDAGGYAARYALGDRPYVPVKLLVKEPMELRPTDRIQRSDPAVVW